MVQTPPHYTVWHKALLGKPLWGLSLYLHESYSFGYPTKCPCIPFSYPCPRCGDGRREQAQRATPNSYSIHTEIAAFALQPLKTATLEEKFHPQQNWVFPMKNWDRIWWPQWQRGDNLLSLYISVLYRHLISIIYLIPKSPRKVFSKSPFPILPFVKPVATSRQEIKLKYFAPCSQTQPLFILETWLRKKLINPSSLELPKLLGTSFSFEVESGKSKGWEKRLVLHSPVSPPTTPLSLQSFQRVSFQFQNEFHSLVLVQKVQEKDPNPSDSRLLP